MANSDAALYPRWVLANGWAEAVGLGTTLLLGRAAAPFLGRAPQVVVVLIGAVLAVVLCATDSPLSTLERWHIAGRRLVASLKTAKEPAP